MLERMVPDVLPMLASSGVPSTPIDEWAAEPKLDGWRVRVAVDGALPRGFSARTRSGRVITEQVPEFASLAAPGRSVLLDGELVAGAGLPDDFHALAGLLGRRRTVTVTAVFFDVLWVDGELVTGRPYRERRRILEELELPGATIVSSFEGIDAAALFAACTAERVEGMILKRLDSPYRAGQRSSDWRKIKTAAWADHADRRIAGR